MNYYNDNDQFICSWLRELIKDGLIPEGEVDDRSITEIEAKDLRGFVQCHFFAGIAGWPRALDLAGWPSDSPVWSGSCPCQPLSCAGKRKGHADDRHLWPAWFRLIAECRPAVVFGEQVASKDGREWLCGVRADLESLEYAVGAADLCAAGIGAPHIRQRLFWVAVSENGRCSRDIAPSREEGWRTAEFGMGSPDGERLAVSDGRDSGDRDLQRSGEQRQQQEDSGTCERVGVPESQFVQDSAEQAGRDNARGTGTVRGLADAHRRGREAGWSEGDEQNSNGRDEDHGPEIAELRPDGGLGIPDGERLQEQDVRRPHEESEQRRFDGGVGESDRQGLQERGGNGRIQPGAMGSPERQAAECRNFWSDSRWIWCRDGKWRRVPAESEIFPLSYGVPNRVGTLRGAGNAICAPVAAEFVRAVMEAQK